MNESNPFKTRTICRIAGVNLPALRYSEGDLRWQPLNGAIPDITAVVFLGETGQMAAVSKAYGKWALTRLSATEALEWFDKPIWGYADRTVDTEDLALSQLQEWCA